MKRPSGEVSSPSCPSKYPRRESEARENCRGNNLEEFLKKHGISLNDTNISFQNIDLFFKDLITSWKETNSSEEIRLFEMEDVTNLLNHKSIKQYFKLNLELYCSFVALLTDNISQLDDVSTFLHNENIFHKNLIHEKSFHKYFLQINFPVYIKVLQKFDDKSVFVAVCDIFKRCILNKNSGDLQIYLDEVLKLTDHKSKDDVCLSKDLLKTTASVYEFENDGANIAFGIIFQSLLNSTKDFKLVYKFFVASLICLGFDLSKDFNCNRISKYSNSNRTLMKSLGILSDVLKIIKDNKCDLSCIVNISFSQLAVNLVNSILNLSKTPNKVCYEVLCSLIDIHPLMVEQNINHLLIYSMLSDNSDCEVEYGCFLLKIFETYAKLHRIQNLVSKMLPALKSSEESSSAAICYLFSGENDGIKGELKYINVEKVLPDNILIYFTECVVQMASWQVMNLLKTFIFHLDSTVNDMNDASEAHNTFLEFLCKFTSCLLCSIRMAENTASATVMENFNTSMKDLKRILAKMGEALLKQEHNENLVGAFLNLSHVWTEMYVIFHYYIEKFQENTEIFWDEKNPNYIHSFLTMKQWVLLSQRITNFGGKQCKHLMLKLLVQKLRATYLFGNNINDAVQHEVFRHISLDFEDDYKYIVTEKFMSKHLLNKLDSNVLLHVAEHLYGLETFPVEILDSEILVNALIYISSSKIAKIFKQTSKSLFMKIYLNVDKDFYFIQLQDVSSFITLKEIYEKNLWECDEPLKDSMGHKLKRHLEYWQKLPLPFLSQHGQSLILLILFSLHKSFWLADTSELKDILEKTIIGLLSSVKVDLMDLFEPSSLVRNITSNFQRKEEMMCLLSENIFKDENSLQRFVPGINYLLEHLSVRVNLQHVILILNDLHKAKKSKKLEFKELNSKLRRDIVDKIVNVLLTNKVEIDLIPSYVSCLKQSLAQENDDNLPTLVKLMDDYLDTVLKHEKDQIPIGCTSFFITIIHHKQNLKMTTDLPLIMWRYCRDKEIPQSEMQDFPQLLRLLFENIPNEDFESIAQDLLNTTEESLEKKDYTTLSRHLTTWSYIVASSFNPIKCQVWQRVLENLMLKLNIFKESVDFEQELFNEIMQLELAVIEKHQLMLSPTMIGVFLMSPVILLQKPSIEFHNKFHKCTQYLDDLLKNRRTLVMDRLPTFLKIFRLLLTLLSEKCNNNENKDGLSELDRLADCAHQLEKLVKHLVTSKKHIARIAPHLIADILQQYEKATLYPKVKVHLNNCIYSLISLCDSHAVSYLLRVLSNASTELFKIMFDNYKRFYRFTGKV